MKMSKLHLNWSKVRDIRSEKQPKKRVFHLKFCIDGVKGSPNVKEVEGSIVYLATLKRGTLLKLSLFLHSWGGPAVQMKYKSLCKGS